MPVQSSFYGSYTPVGDLVTIAVCFVILILLFCSFIKRTRSFRIFLMIVGLLLVSAMTTATSVCVSGNIGFVGLVIPHMMRMLLGPDHRVLLPASALGGALFLVVCDSLGRVVLAPAEVRVGIMTALLGTPYFLYLLRKMQKEKM